MISGFGNLVNRHRFLIAFGLILASSLCLLSAFNADMQGDVRGCQGMADDLLTGKLPYRDHVFEYPPYSIPIFLLPQLFGNGEDNYLEGFKTLALLADWVIKLSLFAIGFRQSKTWRALLPLLLYCAAVPFLHFFILQRYDLWPALISLLAVWLLGSGRYLAGGLALAIGIGVKLYPILFVPPLLVLAWRRSKWKPFFIGLLVGLLPIGLLSFYLPWWRFAEFQANRGLQVESFYASILWLGHLFGVAEINWHYTNKWYEVQGAAATSVLPLARLIFIAGVGGSTVIAMRTAAKLQNIAAPQIARLVLIPVLAFVGLNQVFSPQYMIWLLPLAALASLEGKFWPTCAIALATMLTPLFYPVPDYYHGGLNLMETTILLGRNVILLAAWIALMHEALLRRCLNDKGTLINVSGRDNTLGHGDTPSNCVK